MNMTKIIVTVTLIVMAVCVMNCGEQQKLYIKEDCNLYNSPDAWEDANIIKRLKRKTEMKLIKPTSAAIDDDRTCYYVEVEGVKGWIPKNDIDW